MERGRKGWLRGVDLNHRPLGYEPNELPGCSTPQLHLNNFAPRQARGFAPRGRCFIPAGAAQAGAERRKMTPGKMARRAARGRERLRPLAGQTLPRTRSRGSPPD